MRRLMWCVVIGAGGCASHGDPYPDGPIRVAACDEERGADTTFEDSSHVGFSADDAIAWLDGTRWTTSWLAEGDSAFWTTPDEIDKVTLYTDRSSNEDVAHVYEMHVYGDPDDVCPERAPGDYLWVPVHVRVSGDGLDLDADAYMVVGDLSADAIWIRSTAASGGTSAPETLQSAGEAWAEEVGHRDLSFYASLNGPALAEGELGIFARVDYKEGQWGTFEAELLARAAIQPE